MPVVRVHAPDIDFSALRAELKLTPDFPPEVLAEAESAARSNARTVRDLTDIPFVTIDPPGSFDLDQAVQLSVTPTGYLMRYAIADVTAFVRSGGAIEAEARRRGSTQYFPDQRVPLHPDRLGEGAASLLPGVPRPAAVWTVELDRDGEVTSATVERTTVRSVAKLDYPTVQSAFDSGRPPKQIESLPLIGELRAARALRRGGVDLDMPEQEVEAAEGGGWKLTVRAPLPVEAWNAQLSLLTGECAASMMLAGHVGLLRTLPPADPRDVQRLRQAAPALGVRWPDGATPGEVVSEVDRTDPRGAAFIDLAATLLRGAAYTSFDGEPPAQPLHAAVGAPYAHVTAPLRRLADRYATEVCLALQAGTEPPDWARAALAELPRLMEQADRRAHEVERAVVDLTEALVLAGRVGEVFEGAIVEQNGGSGTVVIDDPAVRAKCAGQGLRPGERRQVRLVEADPAKRRVRFEAL